MHTKFIFRVLICNTTWIHHLNGWRTSFNDHPSSSVWIWACGMSTYKSCESLLGEILWLYFFFICVHLRAYASYGDLLWYACIHRRLFSDQWKDSSYTFVVNIYDFNFLFILYKLMNSSLINCCWHCLFPALVKIRS